MTEYNIDINVTVIDAAYSRYMESHNNYTIGLNQQKALTKLIAHNKLLASDATNEIDMEYYQKQTEGFEFLRKKALRQIRAYAELGIEDKAVYEKILADLSPKDKSIHAITLIDTEIENKQKLLNNND